MSLDKFDTIAKINITDDEYYNVIKPIFRTIKDKPTNNYDFSILIVGILRNLVKNWKADYIKMLIDLYDVNYIYSCPKEIDEASKQYIEDNNDVLKFVKDYFVLTNNNDDFLLFKDIKELYKQNKEYEQSKIKDLKNLLEKTMNSIVHDRKKIKNIDYRGVILGWTLADNIIDNS